MDENGWAIDGPIIWDIGRPQPGLLDSPYSPQGELLWLLHRPGDVLVDHAGDLSREMILRFPPVSAPSSAHEQLHAFEKPVAICEHLVRKHSRPGDVVVDASACTGSMSVAPRNLGRRWLYIESNAEIFAIGSDRLASGAYGCLSDDGRDVSAHAGSAVTTTPPVSDRRMPAKTNIAFRIAR